jgi:hypothetical protein
LFPLLLAELEAFYLLQPHYHNELREMAQELLRK